MLPPHIVPVNGNYDEAARQDYKLNPPSSIFWWVVASYGYYHRPECPSILSDTTYDKMANVILTKQLSHSILSHMITEDDLRAGSLYAKGSWQYPLWLVRMYEELQERI